MIVVILIAVTTFTVTLLPQVTLADVRCGVTWTDANSYCRGFCTTNATGACIGGQSCFAEVSRLPCTTPSTIRCGLSWTDANANCRKNCFSLDSDCPTGQACYADLALSPCTTTRFLTSTTGSSGGTSARTTTKGITTLPLTSAKLSATTMSSSMSRTSSGTFKSSTAATPGTSTKRSYTVTVTNSLSQTSSKTSVAGTATLSLTSAKQATSNMSRTSTKSTISGTITQTRNSMSTKPSTTSTSSMSRISISTLTRPSTTFITAGSTTSSQSATKPTTQMATSSRTSTETTSAVTTTTMAKKVIGYYPSWSYYANSAPTSFSAPAANALTHINYAFATVSYSKALDVWYIDPLDPDVDVKPLLSSNCINMTQYMCNIGTSKALALAPFIGASAGSACSASVTGFCANPGVRTVPCHTDLRTYLFNATHSCGQYAYLQSLKQKNPNLKIILSIGGWLDSNGFSAATKPKYISTFVQSLVKFAEVFQFDGIDIDWEYPGYEHGGQAVPGFPTPGGTADDIFDCATTTCLYSRSNDSAQYVDFLGRLKAALPATSVLSLAAPAFFGAFQKLSVAALCRSADSINLMSYDFNGGWSSRTNHQAMLYDRLPGATFPTSGSISVNAYKAGGCPSQKIVLGFPFFARVFAGVTKGSNTSAPGLYQPFAYESTIMSYKDLKTATGWTEYYDADAVGACSWSENLKQLATYDNPASIQRKVTYVKNEGLGGLMAWDLSQDTVNNTLLFAMAGG